jgi:hypothetical protein
MVNTNAWFRAAAMVGVLSIGGCSGVGAAGGIPAPSGADIADALGDLTSALVISVNNPSCIETLDDGTFVAFYCTYRVSGLNGSHKFENSSDVFYKDTISKGNRYIACKPEEIGKLKQCNIASSHSV